MTIDIEALADRLARAICAETCAFYGEPSCWEGPDPEWPCPLCDEPGCGALGARAANEVVALMRQQP